MLISDDLCGFTLTPSMNFTKFGRRREPGLDRAVWPPGGTPRLNGRQDARHYDGSWPLFLPQFFLVVTWAGRLRMLYL